MTTYYLHDAMRRAVTSNIHVHSPERWRGLRSPQTATNWAADTVSAPFVLTSGDNDYGAEVQLLGSGDTPVIAGAAEFDARPILITDLSQATNPYKLRFAWGAGSYADAIAADQYTEFMLISSTSNANQFGGAPELLQMPNLASGTKVWGAVWCATNNATVSLYMGLHEYPEIIIDPNWTTGTPLGVDLDGVAMSTELTPLATSAQVAAVTSAVAPKSTSLEVEAVGDAVAEVAETAAECVDNAGKRFNV
jgi:hypothetical protein